MTLTQLEATRRKMLSDMMASAIEGADSIGIELTPPNQDTLTEHMATLPSSYSWWSVVYEQASAELNMLRLDYEIWYNEQYVIQAEAASGQGKRATIKDIESAVSLCPEYKERNHAILLSQRDVSLLKQILSAFQMKHDACVQLGAHYRREMDMAGGMSTPASTGSNGLPCSFKQPGKFQSNGEM